jgi:secreted Zn-dependent insulinase-like peptidase
VYPIDATIAALKRITPESLQAFADNVLFDSAHVEALLIGNVDKDVAMAMAKDFGALLTTRKCFPVEAAEMEHYRLVAIPRGEPVAVHMDVPNKQEQNSAHVTVYQMHEQGSARTAALTDLTDQLMHRCFAHHDVAVVFGFCGHACEHDTVSCCQVCMHVYKHEI